MRRATKADGHGYEGRIIDEYWHEATVGRLARTMSRREVDHALIVMSRGEAVSRNVTERGYGMLHARLLTVLGCVTVPVVVATLAVSSRMPWAILLAAVGMAVALLVVHDEWSSDWEARRCEPLIGRIPQRECVERRMAELRKARARMRRASGK